MELTFENLLAHINTVYILLTKTDQEQQRRNATAAEAWTHHINHRGPVSHGHDDDSNSSNDDEVDPSLRLKVLLKLKIINIKLAVVLLLCLCVCVCAGRNDFCAGKRNDAIPRFAFGPQLGGFDETRSLLERHSTARCHTRSRPLVRAIRSRV